MDMKLSKIFGEINVGILFPASPDPLPPINLVSLLIIKKPMEYPDKLEEVRATLGEIDE